MTELVDQWGHPLKKELLERDVAGPTITGVRQPFAGYPADGLNPRRLASILREADQGEPLRYFELAELIEERDLHYAGVLGTRKRSVSQVDVTVEAASDSAEDVAKADLVRDWLKRDELADETFDMLDAIGKGVSFTEIVWDSSSGQFWPDRLEWRDPRWFKPDRDMANWLLRGGVEGNGADEELPAFKFVRLQIKAKSGLAVRSGIARIAAWAWMFKAFTQRDWAIFTQTYGQPLRLGKYHAGATDEDKQTLFRAVANIAGDCAAIVPEGMDITFEQADATVGAALYEKRADWLDRQISKAVVGQTNTTDAQAGGLGSGQANVHNDVREDIEKADCKALSAALNRDLIRPWMDLEFGPPTNPSRGAYPRLVIARPQQEDLQQLSASLAQLVPLGLRVKQKEVLDKLGLSEPDEGDEVLEKAAAPAPVIVGQPIGEPGKKPAALPPPKPGEEEQPDETLHFTQDEHTHPADQVAQQLAALGQPAVDQMLGTIEAMMARATDLGELRAMISAGYPDLDSKQLAAVLASGLSAASAAGASDAEDESE